MLVRMQCKMWKAIERLKQGESINVQILETNLYWEFENSSSRDVIHFNSFTQGFTDDEWLVRKSLMLLIMVFVQFLTSTYNQIGKIAIVYLENRGTSQMLHLLLPTYDQYLLPVTKDDEMSKEKEIDKLMALISLCSRRSTNLPTTTFELHQTPVELIKIILQELTEELGMSEPKELKDAAYHKEKMLLCKQEEAGVQLNAEQADWKDDTDDESEEQELEAHYMYMATSRVNSRTQLTLLDQSLMMSQCISNDIYLAEQGDTNITIDSSDICYDRAQDDQDETDDLDQERDLLASLIQKLKCEIDDSKNQNKFLESSNKELVNKLKGEIEDFKTKNKSLESSNNHFKEANNELSKTNQLMFKDLKKFQAELDKYKDVNYASKVEIDCAKAKGDLMSYKIDFEKSSNAYTQQIN
ncbi:hypothetical protein Tco_0092651 [Tanacetum coccineum]